MTPRGGKRRAAMAGFFYAVGNVHNGVTISALNFCGDGTPMRIFGYLCFLIVWLLAPAPMAITVADTASVQAGASDETQSPP